MQPEEAWYSGDALKVVIPPDLAFQLENMPYTCGARRVYRNCYRDLCLAVGVGD
ncbi:MAG: hypothetical protein U1F42_00095 [Candidatus Competibacteraceae bacterium]